MRLQLASASALGGVLLLLALPLALGRCSESTTTDAGADAPTCEESGSGCPCDDAKIGKGCFTAKIPAGGIKGMCRSGTWACENGYQVCKGQIIPQPETCNGQDDDCDGLTDNVGAADAGFIGTLDEAGVQCYAPGRVGICAAGVFGCVDGGPGCVPLLKSLPDGGSAGRDEECNGLDDDCNGQIDDVPWNGQIGCSASLPDGGTVQGECAKNAQRQCLAGKESCVAGMPFAETCDGRDNDCDGVIDGPSMLSDGGTAGACSNVATPYCCRSKLSTFVPGCVDGTSFYVNNANYICCTVNGCSQ